jgi:ABC-2 type transport system ATP-binding protein
MTTAPLLEAERLSKEYDNGVRALDDVSFSIGDGITGILGENGAGKSTAIKIFLGLVAPSSGRATILGHDASRDVRARARIGYMPEHDCLPSLVSASEFLTHMALVSGLPRDAARTRAADTLRHTGLFEERYRPIGGYSTGMKQRVKLAQALVHDPAFVFLDEPTAGLDPAGREDMLALIRRTHREFGISIVFSSHLMSDVERTCDRILVMQGGHVVHHGEVGAFTAETQAVFVEVDSAREALADALRRRGLQVAEEAGGFVLQGADAGIYDHVRDAVVESGAALRRLAPRRRALTELFEREAQ